MKEIHQKFNYVACPHSAIGYRGIEAYLKESNSDATGVFLATAHPSKFKDIVEDAIETEVSIPERLQKIVDQEKKSIKMENDYKQLKVFLLEKYN